MTNDEVRVPVWAKVSIAGFATSLALYAVGFHIDPWQNFIAVSDTFHISLWNRGTDTCLTFFNDAEYGPYRGSIIGIADEQGNIYPPLAREVSFGETFGVYYRYFEWFTGEILWTLSISIWYPTVIFGLPTLRFCATTWSQRQSPRLWIR